HDELTVGRDHASSGDGHVLFTGIQFCQAFAYHLPWQEGVALGGQAEPEAFHIGLRIGAVARGGALRTHQTLLLPEPDLRDSRRREFALQDRQGRSDRHRRRARDAERPGLLGIVSAALRLFAPGRCPCRGHWSGDEDDCAEASPRRGLGWKVSRYLPICTSSPACSTTSSIRVRLT